LSNQRKDGRPINLHAIRSDREVAAIVGLSQTRVMQLERRALDKLARHPLMRQLAVEMGIVAEETSDK
jgi:DNA-directed RNA polymerase sigma subunit (sigma70/sigma32)